MSDPDVKQVKVDNWGIYFLQRLKHFFNRTDYCDLTLQFQDNAQLKVHRLVLSACTEYFELLERTCEMYEDCLVMPDDLQADVVVPIVNFMYTGQLEFRLDLLERLHQTSQIMNMPVLTKLLDAHRNLAEAPPPKSILNFSNAVKRSYSKANKSSTATPATSSNKRSHSKAFGNTASVSSPSIKRPAVILKPDSSSSKSITFEADTLIHQNPNKSLILGEPRPTRYEIPEELETDNIFEDSFSSISYGSQPLMVHPESTKRYQPKRNKLFGEGSSKARSTLDIVECKKIQKNDSLFEEDFNSLDDTVIQLNPKSSNKVSNQLFDQIIDQQDSPKITIESKDSTQASNLDHAKIISEVLKKYPHLVKSNKNIKLKILNTPNTKSQPKTDRPKKQKNPPKEPSIKVETDQTDFTYETDVIDSMEAARLIALGAENVAGPWICLICGTPGKALHFTSYYQFRRHLVEVHNEKPVSNLCEYCGLKSFKRNYLLHHLYTKHGIEPPPAYHFPKCNQCDYIALTEGYLEKHKIQHGETKTFRCNVCHCMYGTSKDLLAHIQKTGHKFSSDKKFNAQCIYCQKIFVREVNLYAHLKSQHKEIAKSDGILADSDEEALEEQKPVVKFEPNQFDADSDNVDEYQIRPDGNIQLISKKHVEITPRKHTILNTSYKNASTPKIPPPKATCEEFIANTPILTENSQTEEIIMIDNNEYVMKDNKLVRRVKSRQYPTSEIVSSAEQTLPPDSALFCNIDGSITTGNSIQEQGMIIKKANINQPIQIVVSSEEQYKALMNSNHSIIFDDGGNKTLTVLSAPQGAATVNSGSIDLDNTQQNDMMILNPESYPLNVSEALPTDNSNIVVVYSHPVDNENKQFQIITSQDIGTQFVQTSAVMTPNYDVISTTVPVTSANIIDAPAGVESWQNNIQEENHQLHITSTGELQKIVAIDSEEAGTVATINQYSDVTLTPTVTQEIPQEDTTNIENVVVEQAIVQEIVDQEQNVSTSMDIAEGSDSVDTMVVAVASEADEVNITDNLQENCTESVVIEPSNGEQIVRDVDLGQGIDGNAVEQGIEEVEEQAEVAEEVEQADNVVTEINETQTEAMHNTEEDGINQTNEQCDDNQGSAVVDEAENMPQSEGVQTLTSEWSEEDDETEGEAQETEKVNNKEIHTNAAEVEESIENIQQEVDKQMTSSSDVEDNPNQQQDEEKQSTGTAIITQSAPATEKISSLLNDWDENDSQEGSGSTNGIEDAEMEPRVSDVETPLPVASAPPKDDKIKILVSDWDDEDDDDQPGDDSTKTSET